MFRMNNFPSGGVEKVKIDNEKVREKMKLYTYTNQSENETQIISLDKTRLATTHFSDHLFQQELQCLTPELYTLYKQDTMTYTFYTQDLFVPVFQIKEPIPDEAGEKEATFWYMSNNNNIYYCYLSKTNMLFLYYLNVELQQLIPYFIPLQLTNFASIVGKYNTFIIDDIDFDNPIIYFPIVSTNVFTNGKNSKQIEIWYNDPAQDNTLCRLGIADYASTLRCTLIRRAPFLIKSVKSNSLYVLSGSERTTDVDDSRDANFFEYYQFDITSKQLIQSGYKGDDTFLSTRPYYDPQKEWVINTWLSTTTNYKESSIYVEKFDLNTKELTVLQKDELYYHGNADADSIKKISTLNNYPLCFLSILDQVSGNNNICLYVGLQWNSDNQNFDTLYEKIQAKTVIPNSSIRDYEIVQCQYVNNKIYYKVNHASKTTTPSQLNIIWLDTNKTPHIIYTTLNLFNT